MNFYSEYIENIKKLGELSKDQLKKKIGGLFGGAISQKANQN